MRRSICNRLIAAYVKPLGFDVLGQILVGMIFASAIFTFVSSGFIVAVPPQSQLHTAEGEIDFLPDPLRRAGPYTAIRLRGAEVLVLSCSGGKKSDRDCVPRALHDQFRGRHARVQWFEHRLPFRSPTQLLAELEVEGNQVLSFDEMRKAYSSPNWIFIVSVTLLVLSGFTFLVIQPLRFPLSPKG